MKKYNITVNGTTYEVEVEEVKNTSAASPAPSVQPAAVQTAAPAQETKAAAAPAAEQKAEASGAGAQTAQAAAASAAPAESGSRTTC